MKKLIETNVDSKKSVEVKQDNRGGILGRHNRKSSLKIVRLGKASELTQGADGWFPEGRGCMLAD